MVDARCERAHPSGSTEGNQSNDQSILDQVLTFLAVHQVMASDKHFEQKTVHSVSPPSIDLPGRKITKRPGTPRIRWINPA
jgi:hypothetical protein